MYNSTAHRRTSHLLVRVDVEYEAPQTFVLRVFVGSGVRRGKTNCDFDLFAEGCAAVRRHKFLYLRRQKREHAPELCFLTMFTNQAWQR